MKTIGIKLADGTFYPVLEEGTPKKRMLDLTTAKDNQTKVQIDLYRSESGSMDDAEYVDTLEVTKLVPHPNGEPELHLSLGLDENNNLTAEVVDPETGKKSETEVNLVSKTLAESVSASDFAPTLKDSNFDGEKNKDSENPENLKNAPGSDSVPEDFSFDDLADETLAEEEENAGDSADFSDLVQDDPVNLDPSSSENAIASEDLPEIKSDALEDMPFSFDNSEVFPPENSKKAETSVQGSPVDELGIADKTLEGMDFSQDDETLSAPTGEETVPDDLYSKLSDDATAADFSTKDFDLPDFGSENAAEPDETESSATGIDFSDLPDFDDSEFSPSSDSGSDGEKKSGTTQSDIDTAFDTSALDNFDTSDLDASLDNLGVSSSSSDFSENGGEKAGYTAGSAMDFSDLYDKETIDGQHATVYDEEEKKKTRAPVIICVICAIICVVATILVLFIVPSKYNLIKSRNTRNLEKTAVTSDKSSVAEIPSENKNKESASPVEESPVQIIEIPAKEEISDSAKNAPENAAAENSAPKAQENKIVVAPEPEKVVPEPAAKSEKKPDVKYHIRWGDTLWDLSESYYKNPWKYPKIARYNKIKNPDLIISGTDILIPAE